jgi:Phage integrase, N-terminal SAM-like domain
MSLGSRPEEGPVTKETVKATSTAVLVRCTDPDELSERSAVAGFLAGSTGSTRVSYTTDLRLFAEWCAGDGVRLLAVKRAHVELFARHMEANGRMRSTVARRLSTLASFYRYCHVEGLLRRNPAANVRRPNQGLRRQPLELRWPQISMGRQTTPGTHRRRGRAPTFRRCVTAPSTLPATG